MSYILVLVSSDKAKPLGKEHLNLVGSFAKMGDVAWSWLKPGKAAEVVLKSLPEQWSKSLVEDMLADDRIDFFVIKGDGHRKKKLLVSDMDNTMIIGETLDELAGLYGLKEEIAAITEKAMCGELDFSEALRTRVLMLKGLAETALSKIAAQLQYMPGGETLVRVMRDNGAYCVLVSGGFSCFTAIVAERLGFHAHHGNILECKDNMLTGHVVEPILDYQAKLMLLEQYTKERRLLQSQCLAVGDGANDLAMISAAGLGVGYHPKQFLKERADNSILYGDLTALLYVQGYRDF